MSQVVKRLKKSTFPFRKCTVCNDTSTGIHYGRETCEGCKGFYKRSLCRKDEYTCHTGNECKITPFNRNQCKACRFRKCIEVGMDQQEVKMGRISRERRRKLLKNYSTSQEASFDAEKEQVASILLELQATLVDHKNTQVLSTDKSFKKEKKKSSKYDLVLETQCTYLIDNSTSKYDDFLAKVAKDIFINANEGIWRVQNELKSGGIKNIKVIDLSQDKLSEKLRSAYLKSLSKLMFELLKMPALNELPGNNIKIMIETQSLCLLLLQHVPLFHNNESYLMIGNCRVDRKTLESCFGLENISQVFQFCELQQLLNLTTNELALIMACIFTTPNEKFENPSTMVHIHENILHALKSLFHSNERDEFFSEQLNQLIQKLSEINRLLVPCMNSYFLSQA